MEYTHNKSYRCKDEHLYDSIVKDGTAVLPTEVLHYLDLEEGTPLYFIVDSALGLVRLEKSPIRCAICDKGGELGISNGRFLCRACVEAILSSPPKFYYGE